ncbi:MAG: methyltransferase domain-containing protein [Myxococcales bacterium]|nr:methyltransferase domain-containing protein [Myxococcales bacterium]
MSVSRRTGLASVHEAEVCQDLVAGFGTWMSTSRRSTRLGCDCRWFSALVSRFEQLTRSVPSGAIVLDVGCRTGGVAYRYAIARPDVRVIGLDRSPRMLRELRLTAQGVPRTVDLPGSKQELARLTPPACTKNLLTFATATSELPLRDASVSAAVVSLNAYASSLVSMQELSRVTRDFAPMIFMRRVRLSGEQATLAETLREHASWQDVRAMTRESLVGPDAATARQPELACAERAPRKRKPNHA